MATHALAAQLRDRVKTLKAVGQVADQAARGTLWVRRIGNLIGNPPAGCGRAAATYGETPAPFWSPLIPNRL